LLQNSETSDKFARKSLIEPCRREEAQGDKRKPPDR
jgi:hypothetical protein